MSHYEERLEKDLLRIRSRVAEMGTWVEEGLANAIRALETGDYKLASSTILADHPINRRMREIDQLCHAFIAVHLPSAGHLRLLSAVIRVNIALERIGDYAVTIARVSEQLPSRPEGHMANELARISNQAKVMLNQSITAFNDLNPEAARATMVMEAEMEFDLESIYAELMANSEHDKVKNLLAVFIIFTHLKRVADQAKNLCEETVFAATGETKAPKVYNILFLDNDNSFLSQMAEAIAAKSFPGSGNYSSGGLHPANALNKAMAEFMEGHGFDLGAAKPKPLDLTPHELAEKHVIVSLDGAIKNYFPLVPFHTTGVEWSIDGPQASEGDSLTTEQLETSYRQIASEVHDLMHILRGEDAP
ncbi:phosphate signaling complex protein PhoU [Pseudomonadota bacterium]